MSGSNSQDVQRAGGILLHPVSLPSPHGIGDIGPSAHRWLEWLQEAGCTLWQILPLGPPGYGESPYQSFSSYAGNPLLISLEGLIGDGLLTQEDTQSLPSFPLARIAYGEVFAFKHRLLGLAARRFFTNPAADLATAYQEFYESQRHWLDDFALFMALKDAHAGTAWTAWESEYVTREPAAIARAGQELAPEVDTFRFLQFVFFRQWNRIRQRAASLGVTLIGDLPIYVAHDSVDAWVNPHLFHLDGAGMPTHVAGVPPDYFTPTGQRWGNPLYRWDRIQAEGFEWWVKRFQAVLDRVDLVRFDHFLGLERYWEIPVAHETAENGRWLPAPGRELLHTLRQRLGALPVIAEDLGVITPEVEALRDDFDLPGMKILQFAFGGGEDHPYLPHNYPTRCVAYTGTHDNDTSVGWYEKADETIRDHFRRYTGSDGSDVAWDMIRSIWQSAAERAIAPMQDVLGLGSQARMNVPGEGSGNWAWRMRENQITPQLADALRTLTESSSRARA